MGTKEIADRATARAPGQPPEALPETDRGPGGQAPERRCIVTRSSRPPEEMIRFVGAPDGTVAPDLKNRLPGRGAWVTARRWAVEEAVRRNLFARALKARVSPAPDLADQVAARLRDAALGALGLERRAGRLAVGFSEVEALTRRGDAALVIHAAEAAADGVRKLEQAAHAAGPGSLRGCRAFTAAELSLALGGGNVIHAALERGRGSVAAVRRCLAYECYLADAGEPAGRK